MEKIFMKRLSLLIIFLLLASMLYSQSVSSFTEEEIPSGKSIIYIYRPGAQGAAPVPILFTQMGPLGVFPQYSYYSLILSPGSIKFMLPANISREIIMNIEANKAYYVKVTYSPNAFSPDFGIKYEIVSATYAKKEEQILSCQHLQ